MKLVARSSSRLLFALPLALAMVAVAATSSFGVTIYTWNGAVDSDFTNAGNWSGASVAPTNTTGDYRITVNNGSGRKLVYTAAQGHTIYTSGDRALFIGTGASGAMTITGGIFESQATSQDGLCNTSGTATLTIDGGEYRNTAGSGAQTFLVAFGSGGTGNLVIENGAFSVTTLRYQGGSTTGNVYLNGGTLSVGQITDSGGISNFFFDGGALVALKTTTSFLSGLDNAQILAGGAVIDTNDFDITIGQSLSDGGGGGGLTKIGTGTLTLSGNNTYTGTTSVEAGTLTVSGGNAIGNSSAVTLADVAGVTLNLAGSETVGSLAGGGTTGGDVTLGSYTLTVGGNNASTTFAGTISGTGGLTKTGSGELTLTGTNTYSGATTVSNGTLTASGGDAIGDSSAVTLADAAGAILNLTADETIGSLAGGGATGGDATLGNYTLTVGGNNASTTFAGTISGTGGLTKTGSGTLTLSRDNTYAGLTTVSSGRLLVADDNALGSTAGATTVAGSAAVVLADGITVSGETISISNSGASNVGNLQAASGATAEWAGDVIITANPNYGSRIGAQSGGTLIVSGQISDGGNGYNLGISADQSSGTVIISGTNNTYGGNTEIVRGTLQLGADNALPTSTRLVLNTANINEASTFDLAGFDQTIGGLTTGGSNGSSLVTNTGGSVSTLTVNNSSSYSYAGVIAGNLSLVKTGAGTLTLSGGGADYNSFTGQLAVKEGTLSVYIVNDENEDGRLGNSDLPILLGDTGTTGTFRYTGGTDGTNKKFTLAAGGTGTINVENSSTTLTLSGAIDGDGALIKTGSGTLVLAGSSSYTGLTTVSSGKLRITNGSALGSNASGTVVPQGELGLEGDITVNGEALTLGSSGSPATLRNISGDNVWTGDVTKAYVAYLISDAGTLTIEGDIGGTENSLYLQGAGDGEISGDVTTAYAVRKSGAGTWTLSGNNTHAGFTEVLGGALLVNGTNTGGGDFTVSGGTLGGSGTIGSAVLIEDTGTLSPGNSPGILTLNDGLTFTGGSYEVDIEGTTAGTGYDQVVVTSGDVDLGLGLADLLLNVDSGYSPAIDDYLWIIDNTGSGATSGYFTGLADGSSFDVNGQKYYIYYNADHDSYALTGGNDVLLTSVPEPTTLAMLLGLAGIGLLGWLRRRPRG